MANKPIHLHGGRLSYDGSVGKDGKDTVGHKCGVLFWGQDSKKVGKRR